MDIRRINPKDLHETPGYHHILVVETGRVAYLSGQCPIDKLGQVVGSGDLDAQVDAVVDNCVTALAAVNATPIDVVRSTIYVVTDYRKVLGNVWQRLLRSPLAPAMTAANTLVGVAQLGFPDQLIEIELTAALP